MMDIFVVVKPAKAFSMQLSFLNVNYVLVEDTHGKTECVTADYTQIHMQ